MAIIYAIGESLAGENLRVNEDSFQINRLLYPDTLDRSCRAAKETEAFWQYYSLADGVGGAGRGDLLARLIQDLWSKMALDLIANPPLQLDYLKFLETFYARAEHAVNTRFNPADTRLLGASIATALFQGEKIYLSSVGSCRLFMKRDGRFYRMSKAPLRPFPEGRDYSALSYPGLSIQSGLQEEESFSLTVQEGDEYYLLSDGICRVLPPKTLETVLLEPYPIKVRIERLMRRLKQKGLRDSASILVLCVQKIEDSDHRPEVYDPTLYESSFDEEEPLYNEPIFQKPSTLSLVLPAILVMGLLFAAIVASIILYFFYFN